MLDNVPFALFIFFTALRHLNIAVFHQKPKQKCLQFIKNKLLIVWKIYEKPGNLDVHSIPPTHHDLHNQLEIKFEPF